MRKKPYELGILVGRFQTLHAGHVMMIRKALELCSEVGLFIGSSQESLTEKNPFDYETRRKMLEKVFGKSLKIFPLIDVHIGNFSGWGEYVLGNVVEKFGRSPDLLISGKEERRISWFDGVSGLRISELYIPKLIDISASEMREFLLQDDEASWKKYSPEPLWTMYEDLRAIVLQSADHHETESI